MGVVNIQNWSSGKFQDISREMHSNGLDIMAVTQTNLKGKVIEEDGSFLFLGKGRSKWDRLGGGIGMIIN